MGLTDTGPTRSPTRAPARMAATGWAACCANQCSGRWPAYEDVNDADRLSRDPAMRWVVGARAITGLAASASQIGRFETARLTRPQNLAAFIDLPGRWIDTNRDWIGISTLMITGHVRLERNERITGPA
jgi:hypothetical protein